MVGRRAFHGVTRGLVLTLVFAQIAVAASACLTASAVRAEAIATATHEGCDMRERNLNLCVYHCADQRISESSAQPGVYAPPMPAQPVPGWIPSPAVVAAVDGSTILGRATGPPISILHCRFRI